MGMREVQAGDIQKTSVNSPKIVVLMLGPYLFSSRPFQAPLFLCNLITSSPVWRCDCLLCFVPSTSDNVLIAD